MNSIASVYLTGKPDPQRLTLWQADCDATVERWVASVRSFGGHAFIIHDGCSPGWISRWQSERLRFVAMRQTRTFDCLSERFWLFERLIRNHCDIEWWCLTDLSDVEFYRDPFSVISDPGKLYLQSEAMPQRHNAWVRAQHFACYQRDVDHPDDPVFNPGIIGGHRTILLRFLGLLMQELELLHSGWERMEERPDPEDMPREVRSWYRRLLPNYEACGVEADVVATCRVARDFEVVSGAPLHTRFRSEEGIGSGCAIKHK